MGAGRRTKHIGTRYFWKQERVLDGHLSIKKALSAKNCADVGTKPAPQHHNNTASLQDWYSTDHGSHTPLHDEGDEPLMYLVKGCSPDIDTETRRDHGKTRAQKQTVVSVDSEHRDGSAS